MCSFYLGKYTLRQGSCHTKLLMVKKVQIVYLLKQLCSCYRITSEWNVVALLSFHYQQNTRTPSVSLCANHAMRLILPPWANTRLYGQRICQGNKFIRTFNLEDYFSEVTLRRTGTDCNLLCWYKPKVSTASKSV